MPKMGCGLFEYLSAAHTAVTALLNLHQFTIFRGRPCLWLTSGILFVGITKAKDEITAPISGTICNGRKLK